MPIVKPSTDNSIPSENQKTLWQWIWSWVVIGAFVLFMLGGGISFMTSSSPYIADSFFFVGFVLFLCKFLTWDLLKRHKQRKIILRATLVVITLATAITIFGNHYLNREHLKQPDVAVQLVYKKSFAIVLRNISADNVVVRDPQYTIVMWDLDLPGRIDVLPMSKTYSFNGTSMRKEEYLVPQQFTTLPQVAALIKPKDRLFGWITVTCPDCIRNRAYWIYAVQGEDGWYSEIPKEWGYPPINTIIKTMSDIRKNPEIVFKDVLESSRHPIEDFP
ncbi:MAG: hypothetical protein ACHP65_10595 [Legionellales bacterium]